MQVRPRTITDLFAIYPHITDRDRRIMALIHEHQVLTTGQIHRLEFQALRTCQLRLAELRTLGLLDRFRFARADGGSDPWHWTLGLNGWQLQAAISGENLPTRRVIRERTARLATSPTLTHLVATNELFIRLATHARGDASVALARWWSERTSAARFLGIRPDGHGLWTTPTGTVGFFVESDQGTETLTRVIAKLTAYRRLTAAGGPRYPVLFWLSSRRREANLHQILIRHASSVVTAMTTQDTDPAATVWLPGDGIHRVRLADLASDHGPDSVRNPNWTDGELDLGSHAV